MSAMDGDRDEFDGGDAVLAGEYVLGVLGAAERAAVAARIAADPAFAALVRRWEADLAPFNDMYAAETPPPRVYAGIERRLFPPQAQTGREASGWWQSLALWRGLAFASLALVVGLLAANIGAWRGADEGAPALVAELTSENAPVNLVAMYSAETGSISITPVAAGTGGEGRSLELWLIDGDNAPVSLGLVPEDGRGELVVDEALRGRFTEGAVFAISLEPEGGSPTGAPTGPVVASGPARAAD